MAQKVAIEKLRGRENYETWKITVKSYLTINDYWDDRNVVTTRSKTSELPQKHMVNVKTFYFVEQRVRNFVKNTIKNGIG